MTINPRFAWSLLTLLMLSAVPAFAVNRTITITAPSTVKPGASVHVDITVATDATDAEQIGFFHAEYSSDNGATWSSRYAEALGRKATRAIDFPAGVGGSKALIRVRIAFRGGKAGDVDFTGAPIDWAGSWGKWQTPPAKTATIEVGTR